MSSFVDTPKNEIPGAALELWQLKTKQFSPGIVKFSTKHEDNPFTLNCYMIPCTFFLIKYKEKSARNQARVHWVLLIFGTPVIKTKRPVQSLFPDYLSISYDYGFISKKLIHGK